jgi:hypothetical protein
MSIVTTPHLIPPIEISGFFYFNPPRVVIASERVEFSPARAR